MASVEFVGCVGGPQVSGLGLVVCSGRKFHGTVRKPNPQKKIFGFLTATIKSTRGVGLTIKKGTTKTF